MATYRISACYRDSGIEEKVLKQEPTDIRFVMTNYHLTVNADDMKKAYDIAIQYLPVGSDIEDICLDRNPRYGCPEPF